MRGFATSLQIEDYDNDRNPFVHTPNDTIANMDLDYWEEHTKASVAIGAHLLVPVSPPEREEKDYLPIVVVSLNSTPLEIISHESLLYKFAIKQNLSKNRFLQ